MFVKTPFLHVDESLSVDAGKSRQVVNIIHFVYRPAMDKEIEKEIEWMNTYFLQKKSRAYIKADKERIKRKEDNV